MSRARVSEARSERLGWPDRLIEAGALFLLVFTPLAHGTVEPWSEAIAELVVLTMVLIWVGRMIARGEVRIELPPGWRPGALFLGLVLVQALPLPAFLGRLVSPWAAGLHLAAAAFAGTTASWMPLSLDPQATWRQALKLLGVALFFLVVYNTCRTRAQVRRALWTMVLMGALIAVLGIAQRATWNGHFYWIGPEAPHAAAFGPFVNRTHFAGLMVIVVPMALALLLAEQREPGRRRHTSGWRERLRSWNSREGGPTRLVPWLILLMGGAALVSGSRGGVVALIAALIAMIGLSARARSRSRRVVTVVVAAALIVLAGFWIGGDILLGTVERLAEEVGRPDESVRVRLWADALALWRQAPLVGTGLASFGLAIPALRTLHAPVAFTHAESDWVQLLPDTGALGLLLILLAAGSVARALTTRYREAGSAWSRAIALGGLIALVGAAIQGIPNFNLAILSNWLYLGLAMAVAARRGEAAGLEWPEPAPLAPEPDAPSPPRTLAAGARGTGIQAFRFLLRFRRPVVWVVHFGLVVLSSYLAFWLRFDGAIPDHEVALWWETLPALLLIRGITFVPFKLYQGVWRYVGIWDLRNIVAGVATSSAIFYLLVHWGLGLTRYPRSVILMDALLLVCFMAGVRLARRLCRALGQADSGARMLVFGAGDAGEMIVREMVEGQSGEHRPVGFVDDDRKKTGQRIHGVPVLGTRQDLPRIMDEIHPTEVLIAIPRATPRVVRELVQSLEPFKVPIRTLPYLRDILDGRVTVSQIRDLAVEDLLGRAPVTLDVAPIRRLIAGKRVLVTGAGGSIGSELCRQIAALEPAALVLYDRYENALWAAENSLEGRSRAGSVRAVVGDVTDARRVGQVLAAHRPDLVFHAAAHKHVPLMEGSPCEAVKNNVTGTRTVAQAAARHGVERFVLISSDKAVNPLSVMGATKRVAELIVQGMAGPGQTCFVAVRFGNVLGSNGSVVPRFLEQIRAGGPVTVTHPEVRRYFMLIPEAVQLVLHAAALGQCGAIYVLEMGEEIRILDMARSLIRLAGFVPEKEIPITFIGLRPGEKLEEELVGTDETVEPSPVPKILRVRPRWTVDPAWLARTVAELEQAAAGGELPAVIDRLREIAPTFRPAEDRPSDGRGPVLPQGLGAVEAVPASGSP